MGKDLVAMMLAAGRMTPTAAAAKVLEIAAFSRDFFHALFGTGRERAHFLELLAAARATASQRSSAATPSRPWIQVSAPGIYFPWTLLSLTAASPASPFATFVGTEFNVTHWLPPAFSARGAAVSVVIPAGAIRCDGPVRYALMLDTSVGPVKQSVAPGGFFEMRRKTGKIDTLPRLRAIPSKTKGNLGAEVVAQYLAEGNHHVAHYGGHAEDGGSKPHEAHLTLTDKFKLRIRHFRSNAPPLPLGPIVVLAGCSTGSSGAGNPDGYVPLFLEMGAPVVVAAESEVHEASATRFAHQLHAELLGGSNVGDAVAEARRLLASNGDPVGYFFSIYGEGRTRLDMAPLTPSLAA